MLHEKFDWWKDEPSDVQANSYARRGQGVGLGVDRNPPLEFAVAVTTSKIMDTQ